MKVYLNDANDDDDDDDESWCSPTLTHSPSRSPPSFKIFTLQLHNGVSSYLQRFYKVIFCKKFTKFFVNRSVFS